MRRKKDIFLHKLLFSFWCICFLNKIYIVLLAHKLKGDFCGGKKTLLLFFLFDIIKNKK
jgi:hypothetical protein